MKRRSQSQKPPGNPEKSSSKVSAISSTTGPTTATAPASSSASRRSQSVDPDSKAAALAAHEEATEAVSSGSRSGRETKKGGVFSRMRERSRSRSRRNSDDSNKKELLVAVTSCRSDGYSNQKAPGSTSKLPRKAPTNLKLFHELAVGVKDAYAAVGATPQKPTDEEKTSLDPDTVDAMLILWDFMGNLDFVSICIRVDVSISIILTSTVSTTAPCTR